MQSVEEWKKHWNSKSESNNPIEVNGYCLNGKPIDLSLYQNAVVLPAIERLNIKSEHSVLEIGCGTGLMLDKICQISRSVIGFDISKNSLEKYQGEAQVFLSDALSFDYSDYKFDRILMFSIAHYFPDFEYFKSVFDRATNSLSADGLFLIGDLLIGPRPTNSKYFWYDREKLLTFLDESNFRYSLLSQNPLKREINKRWDILIYAD